MHLPRKQHTSYFKTSKEGNQRLPMLPEQTDRKVITEMNYLKGIFRQKLKKRTKQSKKYQQRPHKVLSQRETREIGNQSAINLILQQIRILTKQEVQANRSLFSLKLLQREEIPRRSSKHNRQCSAQRNRQAQNNRKQLNLACTVKNIKNTRSSRRNSITQSRRS